MLRMTPPHVILEALAEEVRGGMLVPRTPSVAGSLEDDVAGKDDGTHIDRWDSSVALKGSL
jgi:hypothetical protein